MRLVLLLLFASSALGQAVVRESLTGTHHRQYRAPECVVYETPLRPFACRFDAEGRLVERVPLFFNSTQPALVFDPNPVAALNDPSLMDQNDASTAVPGNAYEQVEVDLRGPSTRIVDLQPPATAAPDPDAPLLFDRGDDRFEPVNAAFHIDRTQRYLQSLGYVGRRQLVPYAIEVDALAATGADASYFLPSAALPGQGTLYYGTGGTDDAEDADLVVHEYGHAILEWIAPGTFGGTFDSESRALSEGFCDYLAFSSHYAARVASGRDAFCFGDWDARCWTDAPSEGCAYPAGSDCLRRLDSTRTMADYQHSDVPGVEHRNGQIWSSALRELFLTLGRRTTDILVLESLFDAPPQPTYAVVARRLLETDRLLYAGAHGAAICSTMTSRGILASCDDTPRGELTHVQSPDRAIVIPDLDPAGITARITIADQAPIERIGVRVDIDHPSRGDLRIELVAPDGTVVVLQRPAPDIAPGVHVTYGFDAASAEPLDVLHGRPAAGTWQLRVADVRSRDVGRLLSWGLVLQLAGHGPKDVRPRGATAQMIPVVAHLYGASEWASDVRIANVTEEPVTATLVFTRSGEDGAARFSAVDVLLQPGHTAAFDDVLPSLFFTSGSGSLEVLGDVVVNSRTYTETVSGGTLGQLVPPPDIAETSAAGESQLEVEPFADSAAHLNVGVTEISGAPVTVSIQTRERTVLQIPPYGHVQIPVTSGASIGVIGGTGRVTAYLSQIDDASGDALFLPARRRGIVGRLVAPAISAGRWTTDLQTEEALATYVADGERTAARVEGYLPDVVSNVFQRPGTAGTIALYGTFAFGRIATAGTTQLVPFLRGDGPPSQELLFVESAGPFRTNVGVFAEGPVTAEVVVRDSAGVERQRTTLTTPGGLAQVPVTAGVAGGRATVRFVQGSGRAYASLVDQRSADATFVPGR